MGEVAPTDNWPKRVAAPDSLMQACADSVEAEIQNDGMYTQLLERVFDPQARAVMLRLQEASRSRWASETQSRTIFGHSGSARSIW